MEKGQKKLFDYFEKNASKRDKWKKRNRFYQKTIERQYSFIIPEGANVIELGCSTGDLLNAVKPSYGIGVDFSPTVIEIAKEKYPHLDFMVADVNYFVSDKTFDYVIISDLLTSLWDVQLFFRNLRAYVTPRTKIIISSYNYLWEPILHLGEFFGIKAKQPLQNWLSTQDIENILKLENYEIIKVEKKLFFPKYIPLINLIFNKFLVNLPGLNNLALIQFLTARPVSLIDAEYSVSVVVPARNEKGNIENAIKRTPKFGSHQEFIFIEGNSSDGTYDEMLRVQAQYPNVDIKVMKQSGKGKGNAVREAFEKASGEVLMILDADLTTPPEDMPKFYDALKMNKGEFINGCRLVYPMEDEAMRYLNFLGNKFFGWFFSYLLGQRLKDTLCGTKVLFKTDYDKIIANRSYFGDFDPFGDFDLLFGAAKLNLKITEVIVRYRDREYGSTQISRFSHGWLLIKMSLFAARKIKFK
ncbi:MAG TPA: bifunctional class I SAM-dependent methyltransferase/glycosyltransferase family 2 protein [Prolixibacteraceae bacterium]|nr:bifunctional class I SAM-dependent methyltransferase/glycosyltransferase family 2 protein [Prolixibacteraceae bacterium]